MIARLLPQETRCSLVPLGKKTKELYQKELLRDIELFSLDFASRKATAAPISPNTPEADPNLEDHRLTRIRATRILVERANPPDATLSEGAENIRTLVTSSLDTFERLGKELTKLHHLVYKVDLSAFTGASFQSAVSYDRILQNGFLPNNMDSGTRACLQHWAIQMIYFSDHHPTMHITNVLERNPLLESVCLQLQPTHQPLEIIRALGTIEQLTSLSIGGSDMAGGLPVLLHSQTEVILRILQTCHSLNELTFCDLPSDEPFNIQISEDFTSHITRLDLSGLERGPRIALDCEFDCQRIIARCPDLQWVALPRALRRQEVTALRAVIADTCLNLKSLTLTGSLLTLTEFSGFMASLTMLTHLTFQSCTLLPESLRAWATTPTVQHTIQEVVIDYILIGEGVRSILECLPPPPVGSIEVDSVYFYMTWRRSP
ncbi:hypothetical protein BGX31_005652 [Mortierella sp. GBA43]|nr:hypothetical protein BGX31_005652 [Mortierella sp. GBA43]